MLSLCLCALLATTPELPVKLRAGDAEPEDIVTPRVSGLSVPTRTEAGIYLYGALSTSARPLRALLLRSTDGGAHWTEVLPPVSDSEVLFLDFVGCEGRALVGWSTEGPGDIWLYASPDCGATWKRRSKLPKAVWSEWPEHIAWKDGQNGTVWLVDTNEEASRPRALLTRNGGRTWTSPKQAPQEGPPEQSTENPLEVRDPTGTRWAVIPEDEVLRVERQEQGAPAQVRSTLPMHLRRKGKELVPSRLP
ncbi:sialidase family protein [Archangium sp.]|jgi:hypothetical protein|uniref:WD40/YVTN/BNR-like repeat-containing protein n=1 Tax=Archangium sp. TaxID=1872627 RepID=UPI002EDB963F